MAISVGVGSPKVVINNRCSIWSPFISQRFDFPKKIKFADVA